MAFVVFNIIALPLVGILSTVVLPKPLTGTPSPDFPATETAVGQGTHPINTAAFALSGDWSTDTVSGAMRGESCAWYAFWCDEAGFDVMYGMTGAGNGRVDFAYNGQPTEITYSTGPDRGIWAVEFDGQPLLNDEGEPVLIDAYNPTIRYDVTTKIQPETEGEHLLSLVNTGDKVAESSGTVLSVAQIDVLPPLRASNLGAIIGLLIGLQLVAALFAFGLGPRLFTGFANQLDTRLSIILALVAYAIIAIWGFFLNSVVEFWFLAWLVATVQGGSQALSRSLYAAMSPKAMSGEFFGFFSIMSKFASFLSPLVFVLAIAIFDSSRPGVASLFIFFAIGIYLLSKVDVEAGKAFAAQKDAELMAATD